MPTYQRTEKERNLFGKFVAFNIQRENNTLGSLSALGKEMRIPENSLAPNLL